MHRDLKEMLIGSAGIVLFGIALVVSPAFALFVERYFFSYLRTAWVFIHGIF